MLSGSNLSVAMNQRNAISLQPSSRMASVLGCLCFSLGLLIPGPALALYPDTDGIGSCDFVNPFANTPDCVQYTGDNWTAVTAAADCASLFTNPYTFQFTQGGICAVPDHAADCVEDMGTADEKVNLNNATDPSFCGTLEAVCSSVIMGDYFPVTGGVCDTGPPPVECDDLEPEACVAMESNEDVEVTEEATYISFTPLTAMPRLTGVIFFPGAAVIPQAYAPLGQELAKAGIYTAVLNTPDGTQVSTVINAPGNAGISSWALAGHSLGGVVAAKYILANPATIAGLGLLGSFPDAADDLSSLNIKAVTVFATNDLIATPAEVLAAIEQMPADTLYGKIRGGNHAQFGFYGETPLDGDADTSPDKQLELTAASLRHLVKRIEAGAPVPLETTGRLGLNQLTNAEGAQNDFLSASGFSMEEIPADNIDVQRTASVGEFVASKPSTSAGTQPEIHLNQFVNQLGNPEQLDFPPIYDGELQAKFLTQELLNANLGLMADSPQGSCVDANQDNRTRTELRLDEAGLLSAAELAKLDQWTWIYAPDILFPTGPEFIADEDSVVTVVIDELAKTVTVQSPSFFASLDPSNGAAAGRQYCKTLSYERIYLIMLGLIEVTP
jgi:hypothetical protein